MNRKIDIGEDKQLFTGDLDSLRKPPMTFMMDELAKSADDALNDARKQVWDRWINSDPLLIGNVDESGNAFVFFIDDNHKSHITLLDFWDYTLLPCRRALSYILEWQHRYQSAGLVIIGIHTPFFEFGKDKKNVIDACRELGITYPVVQDNGFEIWRAFENRYWPRRILLDSQNRYQKDIVGEGGYSEMESTIQVLLRELSPGLACPPVMDLVRKADNTEYTIPSTTPEIFLGLKYAPRLGNAQVFHAAGEEVLFVDESKGIYAPDLLYFNGPWVANSESLHSATTFKGEASVTISFSGTDAYVVARSKARNPADIPQSTKVQVLLNKRPVPAEKMGKDLFSNEYRRSVFNLREAKLYHVATKLDHRTHELSIVSEGGNTLDTLEIFAIFFEHRA